MTFEITINFQETVVFLKVLTEDTKKYLIYRMSVLSDNAITFPMQLLLERAEKRWQYELMYQSQMEVIIPALEHYLLQQQKVEERIQSKFRIK